MARKWRVLFCRLYSLLSWDRPARWRQYQRGWLALGSCILILAIAAAPGISQPAPTGPEDWFQAGQTAYETQHYPTAVASLNAAVSGFQDQGESLKQAIALGNLSLTHQALGNWMLAADALDQSLGLLTIADRSQLAETDPATLAKPQLQVLAATLDIDGQLWMKQGQPETGLESWRTAARLYGYLGDDAGLIGSETSQLQALQALGLYLQADAIAATLEQRLTQIDNPKLIARSLQGLGTTYRTVGKLSCSRFILETLVGVQTAPDGCLASVLARAQAPEPLGPVLLSLGNTYLALGNRAQERQTAVSRQGRLPWRCDWGTAPPQEAQTFYQQAAETYGKAASGAAARSHIAARLNQLDALLALRSAPPWEDWHTLEQRVANADNRFDIYARIKLAQQGACLAQSGGELQTTLEPVLALLAPLPAMAAELGDPIALSQAYGSLGGLYELLSQELTPPGSIATNRWHTEALTLTQQALYAAQPSVLPDIAYPWQWQLARLHQAQGETDLAIRSYRQAVTTLRSVRNNLLPIDSEVQFSFRDNVEPVYRELVDLLLRPDNPSPETLREAIGLIDTLQLAELESFLQCNLATAEIDQDVIDPTAVNVYSIILPDRLETIIARSGPDNSQRLTRERRYIQQAALEDTLTRLQTNLRSPSGNNRVQRIAGDLYDWMLAPLESQLDPDSPREDSPVKTLAFILDGSLRNVPMAVLFDRQRDRYLLERYAIATVPSLSLVQPEPLPRSMTVLLGGTSEALNHPLQPGSFRPLKNVKKELEAIQPLFKNDLLLDKQFTYPNLKSKLNNNTYTVVHLASHGEFSSDPERTFIMLSQGDGAADAKTALFAKEIDALLRSSRDRVEGIKLLVLSACTTATGDKRATLGMAGLTVRAGSRSTLATLWSVDDASAAALMERFYQELSTDKSLSKAEALRRAQLALPQLGADQNLDWSSPLHWAPYVMVGNWL